MSSDKRNEELLREASANGDEDGVRALLDSGVNINSQHSLNGWTGLHWAAKRGRVPIVRLLLSQGADPSLTSVYGESALSLTNNDEIHSILSGSSDSPPEHQLKSLLPITPNYLSNPSLAPKLNVVKDFQCPEVSHSNSISDKRKIEEELVLKVRTAESDDPDFIEIEIPVKELTYENVFRICCKELDIAPKDVLKLRKLPNTVVRKDKDVLRFQHFQELELVLNVPNTTVTSHTLKNKLSHATYQETNHTTYDNNSETNSPLVKKSNYCKNGTILY